MVDELLIDETGRLSAPEELRLRLARHAGAWRLLTVGPGLLVALRRGSVAHLHELPQLEGALPALAGDLAEVPPSDLLSLLHQGRRSGILLASSHQVERCVVLIDGQVTWAASTSPAERMVVANLTTGKDPWKQLDEKAIEIVFGLLGSESGTFTFLRAAAGVKLPAVFALDTQAVLLDGLRVLDEMKLYRTRVSPGLKPQRAPSAAPPVGEQITAAELKLLELADGQNTVQELAAAVGLNDLAATRACYYFLISGHLTAAPA